LPFQIEGWKNNQIILNVYNPGVKDTTVLKVKVPRVEMQAYFQSARLSTEIFCANQEDLNDCDLYFQATLEPMQLNTFYLQVEDNRNIISPLELDEKYYQISKGHSLEFS